MKRTFLTFLTALLASYVFGAPVSKHNVSGMKAHGGEVVENLEAELLKQAGEAKKDGEGALMMMPMIKKSDEDHNKAKALDAKAATTEAPRPDDGNPIVANKEEMPADTGEQQAEADLQKIIFSLKNNPEILRGLLKVNENLIPHRPMMPDDHHNTLPYEDDEKSAEPNMDDKMETNGEISARGYAQYGPGPETGLDDRLLNAENDVQYQAHSSHNH